MKFRFVLSVIFAIGLIAALKTCAAEKGKEEVYTDIEQAGPDYAVQGEYVTTKDAKSAFGVQVIARGHGKFDAAVLEGGLPGEGFDRTKSRVELKDGATTGADGAGARGETKLNGDKFTAVIRGDELTLTPAGGEALTLKKVDRKSPTLGAKPPEGAIVLFDGSNLDHWAKGTMVEDKETHEKLLASYTVPHGPVTKDEFQDFTLHIEWREPFMPEAKGQGRGNSGVYLQGRYEVQVLDSFGLEGKEDDCGGIYKVATPKINMSYPPLTWQTYDIEMTGARFENGERTKKGVVTVKQNGVVIHDSLELPGPTPGGITKEEAPGKGPLFLQNHGGGDPVVYRNIWIVPKNGEAKAN